MSSEKEQELCKEVCFAMGWTQETVDNQCPSGDRFRVLDENHEIIVVDCYPPVSTVLNLAVKFLWPYLSKNSFCIEESEVRYGPPFWKVDLHPTAAHTLNIKSEISKSHALCLAVLELSKFLAGGMMK